jgi:ATP-dependent protease ClpP protease subunit
MAKIITKTRNQKSYIIEELHLYNILFDTREIFLHGALDSEEDSGVDFRMANNFAKNLRLLENTGDDPIIIHQHSIGGCWDSGMMLYDLIINCGCHVICIMHGTACSMGAIVPQAADTRIIMPNCTFMMHDGDMSIEGTHKQVTSAVNMICACREQMLDIYSSVCVNGHFFQKEQADEKKVRQYIIEKMNEKEDWWLSSRETVAYGFADAVLGDDKYESFSNVRDLIVNGCE